MERKSGVFGTLVVAEPLDTVDQLITHLNDQLAGASTGKETDRVEVVYCIQLYGAALSKTRPLAPLLLEQASGSPRLVAFTTWISKRFSQGRVLVNMFGYDKTLVLPYDPSTLVREVKELVFLHDGIPIHQKNLLFDGMRLWGEQTLAECGVKPESTLYSKLVQIGGGGGPRTFVDVSDGSLLIQMEFSHKAPEWRAVARGLNIEGRCTSRTCEAFKKMVISSQRVEAFNLMEDAHAACPLCCTPIEPVTCGFYDCVWKFEGIRESDGLFLSSPWKDAIGEKYHRFDADETSGSVAWKSLLIVVREADFHHESPQSLHDEDLCTICWSRGGTLTPTRCGHRFHAECTAQWSEWRTTASTSVTCPLCRAAI